jgi:hypothetical protein
MRDVGQSFEAGMQIMIDDSAKSRLDIEVGDDLTKQMMVGFRGAAFASDWRPLASGSERPSCSA